MGQKKGRRGARGANLNSHFEDLRVSRGLLTRSRARATVRDNEGRALKSLTALVSTAPARVPERTGTRGGG